MYYLFVDRDIVLKFLRVVLKVTSSEIGWLCYERATFKVSLTSWYSEIMQHNSTHSSCSILVDTYFIISNIVGLLLIIHVSVYCDYLLLCLFY